jgi:hypothetical protein
MSELIIPEARIAEMAAYHEALVNNPGWDNVADVMGSTLAPGHRMQDIAAMSDRYFDARNGAERQDAPLNQFIPDAIAARGDEGLALFYGGVRQIGLIGTRNLVAPVDTVVIPAALVDANMMRALHAGPNGQNAQKVYVGTDRQLSDAEKARLEVYAPVSDAEKARREANEPGLGDPVTEADSMLAILDALHPDKELIEGDRRFKAFDTPDGRVYWADAPKIEGANRANTRDTYRFLGKMIGSDLGGAVAVSTNDIYKFQDVDARHIFHGVQGIPRVEATIFTPQHGAALIESAGFGPFAPKVRNPGMYAQELRSVHHSLDALATTLQHSIGQAA